MFWKFFAKKNNKQTKAPIISFFPLSISLSHTHPHQRHSSYYINIIYINNYNNNEKNPLFVFSLLQSNLLHINTIKFLKYEPPCECVWSKSILSMLTQTKSLLILHPPKNTFSCSQFCFQILSSCYWTIWKITCVLDIFDAFLS